MGSEVGAELLDGVGFRIPGMTNPSARDGWDRWDEGDDRDEGRSRDGRGGEGQPVSHAGRREERKNLSSIPIARKIKVVLMMSR